jgi:hypothetical protein
LKATESILVHPVVIEVLCGIYRCQRDIQSALAIILWLSDMLSRRQRLCAKSKCQSNLQPIPEAHSPEAVINVAFSSCEPVAAPSIQTAEPLAVMASTATQAAPPKRTLRKGPSKPNFKRLLELANKTQEEVAQALGLNQADLANLLVSCTSFICPLLN